MPPSRRPPPREVAPSRQRAWIVAAALVLVATAAALLLRRGPDRLAEIRALQQAALAEGTAPARAARYDRQVAALAAPGTRSETRVERHPSSRSALIVLLLAAAALPVVGADDAGPGYRTREVAGWTVHVGEDLIAGQKADLDVALALLDKQLAEVVKVVPAPAVAELRKTPLWFSPEYPGVPPRAEFHPDGGWLRRNGRNPDMAKAVEFTNVRIFAKETDRMPNFVLHELAHAYHFRVLGRDRADVIAAFEHAKAANLYGRVERHHGNGRPNTFEAAYAMTDPAEYFAETTEAYFSRNDFFPFTREELRAHDPRMFAVLEEAWGAKPAPAPAASQGRRW
jgi:hypothetical protein